MQRKTCCAPQSYWVGPHRSGRAANGPTPHPPRRMTRYPHLTAASGIGDRSPRNLNRIDLGGLYG